jgi:hypothetical protein
MPALYVNLMPKDQDLGYQRSSRPEQPDQRRPNKAARFPHRTEALRDSAPAVSLIRFTTGTTEQGPAYVPTVLPPLASGLPQNWESIAAGNMVLADEGPGEGWWEAIVIARDNDILTLRYRDYPKAPKFERHISTIGLINPRPA